MTQEIMEIRNEKEINYNGIDTYLWTVFESYNLNNSLVGSIAFNGMLIVAALDLDMETYYDKLTSTYSTYELKNLAEMVVGDAYEHYKDLFDEEMRSRQILLDYRLSEAHKEALELIDEYEKTSEGIKQVITKQ